MTLQNELAEVLNRYSLENGSDTPDWILADYLIACLDAFDHATQDRRQWYGRQNEGPGSPPPGVSDEVAAMVEAARLAGCNIEWSSSRVCEVGTRGCMVIHTGPEVGARYSGDGPW